MIIWGSFIRELALALVPNQGAVNMESRPLPSFVTAIMTNGCVPLLYNNSWKFHHFAAGQLLSGQPVRYGKAAGTARPSHTKSHLQCRVNLRQPARRAAVLDQPSSLRHNWLHLSLVSLSISMYTTYCPLYKTNINQSFRSRIFYLSRGIHNPDQKMTVRSRSGS